MPGLVPGIHVLRAVRLDVDGRDRPSHDAAEAIVPPTASLERRACPAIGGRCPCGSRCRSFPW
ncbi:hypothetical protein C7G42_06965 [Bradyrhizobium sp. MOS003]|nr:hypothetical protein C7G42_06965 [Bradyrhizobium sp. MOS003]